MKWLRLVVSVALLALLFVLTDFSEVFSQLRQVPGLYVAVALVLFACTILLAAYKWRLLLPSARFSMLLRSYLASLFFYLLPTGTLGAEASKLTIASTGGLRLSAVAASVTLDKLTGLAALAAVGAAAGIFADLPYNKVAALALAACSAAIVFAITAARSGRALSRTLGGLGRFGLKAAALVDSIADLSRQPGLVQKNLFVGAFSQAMVIAIYGCLASGLGITYSWPDFAVCVVIANLAAVLPISIAGIGVRELGLVALLGGLGIGADAATALALSVFAVFLVGSFAGFLSNRFPNQGAAS